MNGTDVRRRLLRSRTVRAVRAVVDLGALWRTLARSPLVDPSLYAAQRGRARSSRPGAAAHWLLRGAKSGLVLGPLLVPPVALGPGRGSVPVQAAQLRRAGFPRVAAHPLFDIGWYVQQHPQAAGHRGGPLVHWTALGRAAGWSTHPQLASMPDLVALAVNAVGGIEPAPAAAGFDPAVDAVVLMPERWPSSQALVLATLSGVATLVVGQDRSPLGRLVGAALGQLPGLSVVPALTADVRAAVGATGTGQDPVLVATAALEVSAADVAALALAVRDGGARMAGPVLLAPDGTVVAAGLTTDLSARAAGWSPDDARRASVTPVAALPPDLVVVARADLPRILAPRGIEPGPTRSAVLLPAVTARRLPGPAYPALPPDPATAAPPAPVAVSEAPPRLRWAIKSGHPAGARGQAWGDLHFARALADALERLGQFAVVDPLEAWYRSSGSYDDVTLVLRGLHRYRPVPGRTNLLWVISHPELVGAAELAAFDEVFAASTSWSAAHSRPGRIVRPLLQCTDPVAFHPDGTASPATQLPLLFVGNTRKAPRPLVDAAVAAGLPLSVVGAGWSGRVAPAALLAEHVPNADLPALYRSASVVLNDHWPHMAELGFLSNRLFDLTAVGAAWVSDPATGMDEVFADVARTATDAESLRRLLDAAPESLPDPSVRREASRRIRAQHSFDARAATLVEVIGTRLSAGRH